MTIKEYIEYVDRFEYSQEYFDLLKESYEVSLMDRYIENQEAMMEYPSFFEGCTFLMENVGTDKTSDLKEKNDTRKAGLLEKALRIIQSAFKVLKSFFKKIIERFTKKESKSPVTEVKEFLALALETAKDAESSGDPESVEEVKTVVKEALEEMMKNSGGTNEDLKAIQKPKTPQTKSDKEFIEISHLLKSFKSLNYNLNCVEAAFENDMARLLNKYPNAVSLFKLQDMLIPISSYLWKFTQKKDPSSLDNIIGLLANVMNRKIDDPKKYIEDLYSSAYINKDSLEGTMKHIESTEIKIQDAINQMKEEMHSDSTTYSKLINVAMQLQKTVAQTIALVNEAINNKNGKMMIKYNNRLYRLRNVIDMKRKKQQQNNSRS